jgi:ethanolamine utilization protein EutP (predicted NTPase)
MPDIILRLRGEVMTKLFFTAIGLAAIAPAIMAAPDLQCYMKMRAMYPTIFNSSDVAVITKMDMAHAAEFDLAAARRNIEGVRPGMKIFEVSSKVGTGMNDVVVYLLAQREASRASALQQVAAQ